MCCSCASTQFATDVQVAKTTKLKPKRVKGTNTKYVELAASELKKHSKFKFGGVANMKLKKKFAAPACKGMKSSRQCDSDTFLEGRAFIESLLDEESDGEEAVAE